MVDGLDVPRDELLKELQCFMQSVLWANSYYNCVRGITVAAYRQLRATI